MAWEMSDHMHPFIAPSIQKEYTDFDELGNGRWNRDRLEVAYNDVLNTIDEVELSSETDDYLYELLAIAEMYRKLSLNSMSSETISEFLSETARLYATTTNGGFEFYLADSGQQ